MTKMTVEVGQLFKDKDPRRTEPRILKVLSIAVGKCELAPVAGGGRNTKMTIANLLRRYEYVPSDSTSVTGDASIAEAAPQPEIAE